MTKNLVPVLLIHLMSCFFMTGVIWLVQLLIYPSFKIVGEKEFGPAHEFHMRHITWVVAPAMVLEVLTAAVLFYFLRGEIFMINLASVLLLWFLTAFVNIPTHNRLNFNREESKAQLVVQNWPRTIIWSLRSVFLISVAYSIFKGVAE